MGWQRVAESSAVPGHAGQKEASTRSRHEERLFLKLLRSRPPDGWIRATPQLPHKRSVTIPPRLVILCDVFLRPGRL